MVSSQGGHLSRTEGLYFRGSQNIDLTSPHSLQLIALEGRNIDRFHCDQLATAQGLNLCSCQCLHLCSRQSLYLICRETCADLTRLKGHDLGRFQGSHINRFHHAQLSTTQRLKLSRCQSLYLCRGQGNNLCTCQTVADLESRQRSQLCCLKCCDLIRRESSTNLSSGKGLYLCCGKGLYLIGSEAGIDLLGSQCR